MIEATREQWGIVIGASLLVAVWDVRTRRIPNTVTLPLFLSGLIYAVVTGGLASLADATGASIVLALPYILLFAFCGGGAGDAKMMGAIGAWLGFGAGIVVLVAVATAGAIFGLLNLTANRQLVAGFGRIGAAFYVRMVALRAGQKGWALPKLDIDREGQPQDRRLTIPYGPAIFIGVCIAAFVVHSWNG